MSKKTIFITEKPSVAQEYIKVLKVRGERKDGYVEGNSAVLNRDVIITWAVGHLIGICAPDEQNEEWGGRWEKSKLPMIPKKFKYKPQTSTEKQFRVVKSLYTRKDIEAIYYAGDSGREGIYIQALIRNQIFNATPNFDERVVWIDSYTEQAILDGIKNAKPYSDYQPMIDSGYARAIADWLIGMNFTQAFTLTSGKLMNTGRVMTPTLAMIVNRQKEIDGFTKNFYYGIKADKFATWKAVKGSKFFESDLLYSDTGFAKKEDADKLAVECNADKKLTVDNVKVQTQTEYAPYLFNLADLQAFCSKVFKISPAKTLEIAQSLYEKKFTTYPRTDCRFLSSAVAYDLRNKGYNIPDRYVDDDKVTDHYAIIPTLHGDPNSLSGLESSVYNAIYRRFADTMLPPFIYDGVSVTYLHKNGERFFESFRIIKQVGFKGKVDDEDISNKPIPNKGDTVSVSNFTVNEMETKPPTAYTTGSLILAMEKAGKLIEDEELREQIKTCGIGTSATRAGIIEKLEEKGFITVNGKSQVIAPTDFGEAVIPVVEKYDETLISPLKTADMEKHLSDIADRKLSFNDYINIITEYVKKTTCNIISNNTVKFDFGSNGNSSKQYECPCCGSILKVGRYGWYCDCKYSFSLDVCGHKMKETDLADIISKGKTKTYSFKSKAGKSFKAKLVLNKEEKKNDFEFDNSAPAPKKSSSSNKTTSKSTASKSSWGSKSSTASTKSTSKSTTSSWGKKPTTSKSTTGWGKKK